ncbi:hypothetical protein Tco_1400446 [Tanacetum coccineum]
MLVIKRFSERKKVFREIKKVFRERKKTEKIRAKRSKRVRSGNDFECTYNNDKSLSEIQLKHCFLEKFGGGFEQDIDDESKEDKEDEEDMRRFFIIFHLSDEMKRMIKSGEEEAGLVSQGPFSCPCSRSHLSLRNEDERDGGGIWAGNSDLLQDVAIICLIGKLDTT